MATRKVSGTFTDNGSTDSMRVFAGERARHIALSVVISDGQVDLERRLDGINWRVQESFTESAEMIIDIVDTESYRLTRTGHVTNVDYFLGIPEDG
ncbi:MAG: hypothetical protein AAF583_01585 [Pseudomonadota bacterium]